MNTNRRIVRAAQLGLGVLVAGLTSVLAAETGFARRDVTVVKAEGQPFATSPTKAVAEPGNWRIDSEAPLPERRLSEHNPLVTRRCVFFKEQKLLCDDHGFKQVFPSSDGSRAILTSWSDSGPGAMLLLDRSGASLARWVTSDHHAFVAKAARKADLVVAIFESGGSSFVMAVGMDGKLRWRKEFKGMDGRVIDPDNLQATDDGQSVVASNGRTTRVFDRDGLAKAVIEGVRPRRLSPKQDWVLLCNGKRAVVHELSTGRELFRAPDPEKGRVYSCHDVSADGQRLLLTENSGPGAGRLGEIERIHIVNLKTRSISTAKREMSLGSLHFEPDGRIRAESNGKSELLQVNE